MTKFWNMTVDDGIGYLSLAGDISDVSWANDEITPRLFKQQLDDLGDIRTLNVSINSGGGDVFAGQAIYNMIKNHPAHKVVTVEGLAASIASVIAMAGDEIVMPANALMMIHEAWTCVAGNKHDLRKQARTLDTIDTTIRGVYAARTGLDDEKISRMMAAETWLTADDALELGFCTGIESNKAIAASVTGDTAIINGIEIDLKRYRNADKLKEEDEEKKCKDPEEEPEETEEEEPEDPEEEDDEESEDESEDDKEHSNGATKQPVDADRQKLIARRRALIVALSEIE